MRRDFDRYHYPILNELAGRINEWASRAGFHEPDKIRPFDGMLMNVVSEAAEAQEEWRKGRGTNETYWKVNAAVGQSIKYEGGKTWVRNYHYDFDATEDEWLEVTPQLLRSMPNMTPHMGPEGIPTELADILIRVLHMCAYFGMDIAATLADKMAYNETRPYRNGGKRS